MFRTKYAPPSVISDKEQEFDDLAGLSCASCILLIGCRLLTVPTFTLSLQTNTDRFLLPLLGVVHYFNPASSDYHKNNDESVFHYHITDLLGYLQHEINDESTHTLAKLSTLRGPAKIHVILFSAKVRGFRDQSSLQPLLGRIPDIP